MPVKRGALGRSAHSIAQASSSPRPKRRSVPASGTTDSLSPLRDRAVLTAAAQAAAVGLAPGLRLTAMGFCLRVIQSQLKLAEFGVGQWQRVIISAARKQALGARDGAMIVKPSTPTVAHIPTLECSAAARRGSILHHQHDDHHHEHEDESGDDSGDDCGNGTKSNPRPHPYLALNLAPDDPWWRALERDGAVRLRNLITPEQALIAKPMSATHQRH